MNDEVKTVNSKTYTIGYVLSIVWTVLAYGVVVSGSFSKGITTLCIMLLAVVQLVTQLVFFLHITHESKPRWNLVMFIFMLIVLLTIVIGSLWIMQNLNYNMMGSQEEIETYMKMKSEKGF